MAKSMTKSQIADYIAGKAGITKKQWDSTMAVHPTAAEELVLMREKVPSAGGSG